MIIHPDEPKIANCAINILKTKDLNPHLFLYPSLYVYMQTILYGAILSIGKFLGIFKTSSEIEITTLYFWGRMLTIIFSVGTIYLVYLIGSRLFNRAVAIISILFVSFSFLHISQSFFITTDSPMTFWVILSLFTSGLIYTDGPKLKYYLLNGVFAGLAIGTKYNAIFCVLPMIYAHLYQASFSPKKIIDKKLLSGLFIIPFVFVFTTPFSVIDYKTFIWFLQYQKRAYSGHYGYESDVVSYGRYFMSLRNKYGIIQLILTGVGILILWIRDKRKVFFLLCFPLSYYLFMGGYRVYFDRNMVVLVPFLALFSGYSVFIILDYLKKGHRVVNFKKYRYLIFVPLIILTGFAIYNQTHKALRYIWKKTLPNTRWVSKIWIEKNIPDGAKIGREHYTPPIDTKKYKVTYLGLFGLMRKEIKDFDYIIASGRDYNRFFRDEERYPYEAQKYKEIFSKYKLIKEFVPDNKKTSGPVIRIYKIR